MRNNVFWVLAFAFLSFAAQAKDIYVIEGKVNGAPEGTVVELMRSEDNMGIFVASDTLKNRKFRFEKETSGDGTDWMTLNTKVGDARSMLLHVWVRPGSHVRISGDNMLVYTWNVESGVPEQNTRQKIVESARELWDEYQLTDNRYDDLRDKRRAKNITKEEKARLQEMLDSLKMVKSRLYGEISAKSLNVMGGLEVNQAWMHSFLSLVYMADSPGGRQNMEKAKDLYVRLPEKWKNSFMGREAGNVLFPKTVVDKGDMAADADLYDIDGGIHHLADFRGKYVLVDFWSIGCGPCKMSIPEMKEISEMYKDSLVIVSISIDNERIWNSESVKEGMTWRNLSDKKMRTGIAAEYGLRGIPYYVLISPDGKVIEKWTGYGKGNLKKKIAKSLDMAGKAS